MSFHRVLTAVVLSVAASAVAEPTSISVHVISRDAKFIGSSVGGAQVTISDALTGRVLAQGVTEGGTGDTERIMNRSLQRGSPAGDGAAAFTASVDVTDPLQVRIVAHGPLDHPQAANTVSATQWLVPGGHVKSWILEMPGLIVDVHNAMALVHREGGAAAVPLEASVRMMCGCPITPDGIWDSNDFAVRARLFRDGLPVTGADLGFAGVTSEFAGSVRITEPGRYEVVVSALQRSTGNAGQGRTVLVVD